VAYKLVIFDFDGTLADSAGWLFGVLNQVANRYDFRRVDEAEIASLRGCDNREIVRYLGVPAWKLPLIAAHLRRRAARDAAAIPPFEGAPRVLRALKERGAATAVVSSNAEANVRRILGPECAPLVDLYECGASLFGKAAKFRRVLERAGARREEAICVGDEARDIQAASEAGLASGAATWGYATRGLLERQRPTLVFADMDDMLHKLAGGPPPA
jgi:phosphoglycolate phosphatase